MNLFHEHLLGVVFYSESIVCFRKSGSTYIDRRCKFLLIHDCVKTQHLYCYVTVFTTEHQERITGARHRVTGIGDVPLIACQAGPMSDSVTSSLENLQPSSIDGTANSGYHSSPSDSEGSTCQERVRERELMPSPSHRRMEVSAHSDGTSDDGTDADPGSVRRVRECLNGHLDQPAFEDSVSEFSGDLGDSSVRQETSKPIGAKLVVCTPALNQHSSVRVSVPEPHTCISVLPNSATGYYSDSELIPQRNSVVHSIATMKATEHLVLKQQPRVPQVYVLSSTDLAGRQVPYCSKWKPLSDEEKRHNRAVIQNELHQWHRSLSAGDTSATRHLMPDDVTVGGSKSRAGVRCRALNHTCHVPVGGSADVAGVMPDCLLSSVSNELYSGTAAVTPDPDAVGPSNISNIYSASTLIDYSVETVNSQTSASKDNMVVNMQNDDGVFEELSGNNQEDSSATVAGISQTRSAEQSASTVTDSSSSSESHAGVPNRAILRRGSGKGSQYMSNVAHIE